MGRGCTDNKHSLSRLHYKASSMKLICQIMKGKCRQGCCVKTTEWLHQWGNCLYVQTNILHERLHITYILNLLLCISYLMHSNNIKEKL